MTIYLVLFHAHRYARVFITAFNSFKEVMKNISTIAFLKRFVLFTVRVILTVFLLVFISQVKRKYLRIILNTMIELQQNHLMTAVTLLQTKSHLNSNAWSIFRKLFVYTTTNKHSLSIRWSTWLIFPRWTWKTGSHFFRDSLAKEKWYNVLFFPNCVFPVIV